MKTIKTLLTDKQISPFFQELRIGLEKEGQRVTPTGQLAKTSHPKKLSLRETHPYIQTDFSETQLELITPVFDSCHEALRFLSALHDVVLRSLSNQERIWPFSMPPILPENDEAIQIAKLNNQADVLYRRYLAKVYGKRKQMISGVHYNFEFSDKFLRELFAQQEEKMPFDTFRTEVYLKTSRHYLRYRWLITYLFGASPYAEEGFFTQEIAPKKPVRSLRNSHYGYSNQSNVNVSYQSVESYVSDIEHLIQTGDLIEAKEFYSPVRLRGGDNLEALLNKGISYIELRNIDLDPYAKDGIQLETLLFLQVFIMTMLWLDEGCESSEENISKGNAINEQVALEQPLTKTAAYEEGIWLINQMKEMCHAIDFLDPLSLIDKAKETLERPQDTIAAQIMEDQRTTEKTLGTLLADNYYENAHNKPYQLAGYRDMELSTQLLMFDSLQKGVTVDVLDEADQFLKLTYRQQVEYVKNANKTSRDSYIVPLIMENKTVTKKILKKAGFNVPAGYEFSDYSEAKKSYRLFADSGFVVKPKSTNYGIGISIFKDGASFGDFKRALDIAFNEDDSILVEEFLSGTEYRFFVLDGQTRAVMKRVAANVLGDGQRTIAELVEEKNKDTLRGSHHRAPLELIKLGDVEALMLKGQDLCFESIPEKNRTVYLRENSNISTGGDSIDVTDEMAEGYKKIAEEAVKALGAHICGIDLIIPSDKNHKAADSLPYGIIEANFNPAMHMHMYPFSGESRRLTMDVLKFLFPEID